MKGKNNHATLVMSKLKKFHLKFLKVKWSIRCLEPGSCQNKCQAKWYSFIFKLLKFEFSISRSWRILKFYFGRENFLFWFWEHTKLSLLPHAQSAMSQSNCLKFFLANFLARDSFWLVKLRIEREETFVTYFLRNLA